MLRFTGIIFVAAIFLAGCTTTTPITNNAPTPPISNRFSSLNWMNTNVVHQPFALPPFKLAAPAVKTNPPAAMPQPESALTWTSLNRWAAGHNLGAPRLLASQPVTTYAIKSANGEMLLEIGSREAIWNGTRISLGFEPQLVDGQILLNALDLRKNLEPLLCDTPLTFGANRTIVIDPGHGGSNTGTHSVLDGRFEKEFTLDWAKQLAPLLKSNGWTVFLTRTSDVDDSLSNRVAFAEAHHAALFISLHFNSAAPKQTEGGIETYCLTPTGMPSTLTRGYPDIWSEDLPNNAYDAQNLQLAIRLQSALVRATGLEDRGVRRARFITVLRGQNRPAVLIEAGFLSNPREAALIESSAYRQKLAEAVANALQ